MTSKLRIRLLVAHLALVAPSVAAQNSDVVFNRAVPAKAAAAMNFYSAFGNRIVCAAYPPAGGDRYVFTTDKGLIYQAGLPAECAKQLVAFRNAGHKVRCVAFPPAGGNRWTIVTDKTFFNRGVPNDAHNQMMAYAKAGHRIQWVAYPPAGGNTWSIVTDRGAFTNRGVPSECHNRMVSLNRAGHKIKCVAFPKAGGNRWSVVTDRTFWNRGVPEECHRVMSAMFQLYSAPLQTVAFDASGKGFTVSSTRLAAGLPTQITHGAESFSIDKFLNNLRNEVKGKGVKAGFVIRHGKAVRTHAYGLKRTAYSPPAQNFTIYDRFNPASVTKLITGVAVLRALQNNNRSIDEKIYLHLPRFWTIHPSIKDITFRQLLQHRAGFRGVGVSYVSLQNSIKNGVATSNKGVYRYENSNYALCRILVAYLDGHRASNAFLDRIYSADRFKSFVQKYAMNPCGIPSVAWKSDLPDATRFYPNPPGTSKGTDYGDWSLIPGSAGIHLSLAELAVFLEKLRTSNDIIGATMRLALDRYFLGWDGRWSAKNSTYLQKGGYFPASWNGGAELRSSVVKFSNGLQLTLVTNGTIAIDFRRAYDSAWGPATMRISNWTRSVANVSIGSIRLSGQNLHLTKFARIGSQPIFSHDNTDPTKPWVRVVGSDVLVHMPQGLVPGNYPLVLSTGQTETAPVTVTVRRPLSPVLISRNSAPVGKTYALMASRGSLSTNNVMFLLASPVAIPSTIPNVLSLSLGDNFRQLVVVPGAWRVGNNSGSLRLFFPALPALLGQRWFMQGAFADLQRPGRFFATTMTSTTYTR